MKYLVFIDEVEGVNRRIIDEVPSHSNTRYNLSL